jgi:DNA-binding transcriptional LysR family regulator
MRGPGLPSLDQVTVFLSVVETGSFVAAGRQLGRRHLQSAIQSQISNCSSGFRCSIVTVRASPR